MMMNTINIDSRLTTDVQYSTTRDGVPMARFSIANNQGQHTNFFDVIAFNATAEYAKNYCHKSQKVGITGSMKHYIKPNGRQYYYIKPRNLDCNRDDGSKFKTNPNTKNQPKRSTKDVVDEVTKALSKVPRNRKTK